MVARISLLIVLSVIWLVGCAAPAPPPEPAGPEVDVALEAQAIRDLSAAWLEAYQARDAAAIDRLFAADITMMFDGAIHEGLPAVRAARDEAWTEEPEETVEWTTTDVIVAESGDLAVERGRWTEHDLADDTTDVGEYVTVWTKIDGDWKVLIDAGTEIEGDDEDEGVE